MAAEVPHVVIVGGGFAGMSAATGLSRAKVRITLVDRTNHHLFQPLLYQVATAGLAPSDIAEPIRSILAGQDNVHVRLANVTAVDLEARTVEVSTDDGTPESMAWDKLVIAAGARHSYFGNDAWAAHAPGLKTLGDALDIRRRVLSAFERAEWTTDPEEREALLTFVVVGAGPTGVELAGAIAELAQRTLKREYRSVDTTRAKVLLVEGTDAVLPTYTETLRIKAQRQLESIGVTVRLGTRVTDVIADGVALGDTFVPARTVLWAAGVQGSSLARTLGVQLDRAGRVPVQPDCSLADHRDVFVVGDLAAMTQADGSPVPGVSPAAMQMGQFVAKAIDRDLGGSERGAFRYVDRGSLATIGRSRAVADTMGLRFGGFTAWLTWVFVHIWFLVTFRNRIVVMTKWAWAWFTFERATRLVWAPRQRERR
ncbi:MAG: NAD(P)/FAD-dependent oxidoreductase [Myxococcales bacterium]|nr:NAD(P)/FAD-dependent oxidoreductase [Myxococcales bacterium]